VEGREGVRVSRPIRIEYPVAFIMEPTEEIEGEIEGT